MAITPTHLDSFRSASPSSIPPAADTLTGTVVAPATNTGPQTAFHRRFFGTEIEERLARKIQDVQASLTQTVNEATASVGKEVVEGTGKLQRDIGTVGSDVRPVASELNQLKTSVGDDLTGRVTKIAGELGGLKTLVGVDLQGQVSLLTQDLSGLKTDVTVDLNGKVNGLVAGLGTLNDSVGAKLGERVDCVGAQIVGASIEVRNAAATIQTELEQLKCKVAALEPDIATIKRDVCALVNDISGIKACVDDLKKQLCEPAEPTGGAPKPKKS